MTDFPSMDSFEAEPVERPRGQGLAGFDLGPPSAQEERRKRRRERRSDVGEIPLTKEGHLDLEAIQEMIDNKKLKDAARLLHHADPELPDLAKGLNLVALHAFTGERHHAAHMLWDRARSLGETGVNVLYNLSKVKVELGKHRDALPLLEELLERRPHLTLATELMNAVRDRLGNDA